MAVAASGSPTALRARLLSGSMIMLFSSALVGATNFIYNIAIARLLGAAQFGHATAIYTLLMLLSSVTLAFQIVCSKFVAKNTDIAAKVSVYQKLHRRSWQVSIVIGVVIVAASSVVTSYLNLPERIYVVLLGLGTAIYIPLGVRRGLRAPRLVLLEVGAGGLQLGGGGDVEAGVLGVLVDRLVDGRLQALLVDDQVRGGDVADLLGGEFQVVRLDTRRGQGRDGYRVAPH